MLEYLLVDLCYGHFLLGLLQKETGEDYTQTEFSKLIDLETTGTKD